LEYAHARACSILRKAEENKIDLGWKSGSIPSQFTRTERSLLETLERFPAVVINASKTLRVSQVTEYAFQLASAFTDFYEHPDPDVEVQTPFIHLQNRELQLFRLSLVRAFQRVMASMLSLLGMPELAKI
jgi:arginyl-tRNA synthetase